MGMPNNLRCRQEMLGDVLCRSKVNCISKYLFHFLPQDLRHRQAHVVGQGPGSSPSPSSTIYCCLNNRWGYSPVQLWLLGLSAPKRQPGFSILNQDQFSKSYSIGCFVDKTTQTETIFFIIIVSTSKAALKQ